MSISSGLRNLDRAGAGGAVADEPGEPQMVKAAPVNSPTAPTTLGSLMAKMASEGHRRPGRLPSGQIVDDHKHAEKDAGVALLLMSVAAMSLDIEGFPNDVVIRGPYSEKPRDSWAALRKDAGGVWRLALQSIHDRHDGLGVGGRGSMVYAVGRAMGFDTLTTGGYDTLSRYGSLPTAPEDVESFISKIEGHVSKDVLIAPVFGGLGIDFHKNHKINQDMLSAWIDALSRRGINYESLISYNKESPLLHHMRERGGFKNHVEPLVRAGADIEERDREGRTPLLQAISNGRWEVAKLLIENGASVNNVDRYGRDAMTHLISNVNKGHDFTSVLPSHVAQILIDHGVTQQGAAGDTWFENLQYLMESVGKGEQPDDDADEEDFDDSAAWAYREMEKILAVIEGSPSLKP